MITVTEATHELQRLRAQQRRSAFKRLYRRRTKIEHRIARLIQLGARQARYRGATKTSFQIAILAAVANLSLAVARFMTSFLVLTTSTSCPDRALTHLADLRAYFSGASHFSDLLPVTE